MQKNVLEETRDNLIATLQSLSAEMADYARGMSPYNATQVSPEIERYFFFNMGDYYRGENLDNAAAWQRYLSEEDPAEVLAMVQRVYAQEAGRVAG